MGIPQYFSATYAEARRKFLEAARAAGAAIESHVNPNSKGPNGEELATDVARFGDMDAENLFITCSGTHGNEGFCGSGCQIGFIKEGIISARPKSVGVLLVHAVNPYGFSHVRRVTEDNVDLNRNFPDFSKPLPENPRYPEIHDLLVPSDWDGPGRATAEAALQAWVDKNGMPAFQAAVSGGQYKFPDGLFFGGQRATWSNQIFRAIVKKHGAKAKRVGFIDFHTGLGPTGYGEPIYIGAPNTPGFERARAWWGNEITSPEGGTSKSAVVTGTLRGGIEESLPSAEVTRSHRRTARDAGCAPGRQLALCARPQVGALHGLGTRPRHQEEGPRRALRRYRRLEGKGLRPRCRLHPEGLSRPDQLDSMIAGPEVARQPSP
jgi:Protein of unknown function (DUF2817)